jgi:hypothetical protein
MTMRLLPDIDLARIAPQRDDMKRKSLEQMKGGFSTFSYKPVRTCFSDIFNVQPELDFGKAEPTPWAVIEAELRKRSRSDEEFTYNRRVALGLHDFASSGRVWAAAGVLPLSMGMGQKVTFWLPMVSQSTSRRALCSSSRVVAGG